MTGYIFEHEGKQYDPDGRVSVESTDEHNRQLEAAELAFWKTKPDQFGAYISRDADGKIKCTTWKGSTIGRVINSSLSRNALTGSKMRAVRIAGSNGATYHGRYGCDWSQFVRLRKTRH